MTSQAMAKKGRAKNQHFVPRCLLSRFCENDKITSVFVIGSAKFVPTTGIKTQCAADYYYGHDQTIENELGRLEGAFSRVIGDLSVERLEGLTKEELAVVRAFVHVQAERTPHAADLQRRAYEDLGQQLWAAYAKHNNLNPAEPSEAAKFADAQMPVPGAHTVELATRYQSSIADLEVKFVFGDGFIISDHPTLSLNPWRDGHPRFSHWPVAGGLATKGFMYVMPVATRCAIIAYDSGTYQIGRDGSRIVFANGSDRFVLNGLQTINATRLLFDTNALAPVDLLGALDIRNRVRAVQGEGPLPLRPPDLELSFLTVVDGDLYDNWNLAMLPCRNGVDTSPSPRPQEVTE